MAATLANRTSTVRGFEASVNDSVMDPQKIQIKRENQLSNIIENTIWILATCATIYISDIINIIIFSIKVNRLFFNLGIFFVMLIFGVFVYLEIYLPYFKNGQRLKDVQWEEYAPYQIYFATICAVSSSICFTIGLWPVYSWFTIPILVILLMGFLVLLSLIPDF